MRDPDLDLSGKTALVTGAGRNIGRSVILELASRGANVVINARANEEEAREVQADAERYGVSAAVVMGDVSDLSTIRALQLEVERTFGHLDIYVSNAAARLYKDFFETTDEDWHYYLNQQLTASWYLAKAFVPGMRSAGWGRIIHMNGPDGWQGGWTRIPHATAKGGLRTLTVSLANGLGQYGITVNDVIPGFQKTKRDPKTHPQLTPEVVAEQIRTIPIGRQPTPEEVAWVCAFLCSPRSAAITGAAIHADGGSFYASG